MLKVAIFNFKGGTGKSTTVLNLGACLAASKCRVLLLDLDGQRTLSFGLGQDGQQPTALDWLQGDNVEPLNTEVKNLWLIPGDLGLFQLQSPHDLFTPALSKLKGFDVCLMDCSPGLSSVSVQALLACSRVLIPTLCEPAALKGLSEAVELIRGEQTGVPIEVLRTRYKSRLLLTQEADSLLVEASVELDYRLLHTVIPDNIAVAESIAQQKPVTAYAAKSSGASSYRFLAKECKKLWRLS